MHAIGNEIAVHSNQLQSTMLLIMEDTDYSECPITSIGMDDWLMSDEEEALLLTDTETESSLPPNAMALVDEELKMFVLENKPANAVKRTQSDLNVWRWWC